MNKNKLLDFVYQLQNLRDDVDAIFYTSPLPIDDLRADFNSGIEQSVKAILATYGETVLNDIQRGKEASHE